MTVYGIWTAWPVFGSRVNPLGTHWLNQGYFNEMMLNQRGIDIVLQSVPSGKCLVLSCSWTLNRFSSIVPLKMTDPGHCHYILQGFDLLTVQKMARHSVNDIEQRASLQFLLIFATKCFLATYAFWTIISHWRHDWRKIVFWPPWTEQWKGAGQKEKKGIHPSWLLKQRQRTCVFHSVKHQVLH